MKSTIREEKLQKYFSVTEKAFEKASAAKKTKEAEEILDMAARYISDAKHFDKKGNKVNAFAALNYAHGWLDCGARLGHFDVRDSALFTVDSE